MAIDVNPGDAAGHVPVRTEIIDDEHVPVYKQGFGADGEITIVDEDNPLPIGGVTMQTIGNYLTALIIEQKLTNLYLSEIVGENLRNDIEQENKL